MMAKNNSRGEVRLLPPRLVPLPATQREEAVSLLSELLLDAAEAKRWGVRSGGASGGACDGVIGGVVPLPHKRRKGREAA